MKGSCAKSPSRIALVLLLGALWALQACTTLNKQECLNADWRTVGYEDGAGGYAATQIGLHRKACAKHGVQPDLDLYMQGHGQGVRDFCTPRKGYHRGVNGVRYQGVCPPDLEPAFLQAYNQGRTVYSLKRDIDGKARALQNQYAEMDELEQSLADLKKTLIEEDLGKGRRYELLHEIRRLAHRRKSLLDEIQNREIELDGLKNTLAGLQDRQP